jgi:CheY-like chemotaxis protein
MKVLVLVLGRLAWLVPTLVGLLAIVFFISHVIPADPASFVAGENASAETVAAIRAKLGLDQPLPIQFVRYIQAVLGGDMGRSIYTGRPVSEDLLSRLPATMELALAAILVAGLIGIPMGVVSALSRNSWLDHSLRLITIAGLAMASFWFAILLQLLFSMRLEWTPLHGRVDGWGPEQITGFYTIDALLLAGRHRPDVLLSDLPSRPVDGVEMLHRMRAHAQFDETVLVVVSALDDAQIAARGGLPAGTVHYRKPIPFDTLRGFLEASALRKRRDLA